MLTNEQLIYNALETPDGTVLVSHSVHDFKTYKDTLSNKEYMVDGGNDYIRRNVIGDQIDQSQYYDPDNHEHNRTYLHWGTRGKDGKQPLTWKAVRDLETDHLEAILSTQPQIGDYVRAIMVVEVNYRDIH
jgi:hypothetical protein